MLSNAGVFNPLRCSAFCLAWPGLCDDAEAALVLQRLGYNTVADWVVAQFDTRL
jgi:hypothetical protein